jgi:DNA-3-methyladenine glycosylase
VILNENFYRRDAVTVARELIGCRLVRETDMGRMSGIIVETEAYMGRIDDAAHSYKGKTERVKVLFGEKGRAYVYLIYGMYCCLNVSAGPEGEPECVLIRALEPEDGIKLMEQNRRTDKLRNLCSGPGKLCMALGITREQNGADMTASGELYIETGRAADICASKRIGIDYAEKCRDELWRFTEMDSIYVSKP